MVAKTLVKAMGLEIVKHPNPYKLGWIRKGLKSLYLKSKVTEACQAPCQLGSFTKK